MKKVSISCGGQTQYPSLNINAFLWKSSPKKKYAQFKTKIQLMEENIIGDVGNRYDKPLLMRRVSVTIFFVCNI